MKPRKLKMRAFLAAFFVVVSSATVGFSSWVNEKNDIDANGSVSMDTKDRIVCYNETTNTYYTSIEKALSVGKENASSDVISVIPGVNPTISESCEISSEDTLVLPYSKSEGSDSLYKAVANGTMDSTAGYDSSTVSTQKTNVYKNCANITSIVTIASEKTLTNNGKLLIGGIQSGSGGGNIAGFVTTCAKMVLSQNAKIQNNGTFVNFGYVVGVDTKDTTEAHVINAAGSTTYGPFVVVEHRGGTAFSGLTSCDGSPFNRFYFPSFVNVLTRYEGATNDKGCASFTAIPDLYAGDQHNRCEVSIIGPDGLIDPQENFSFLSFFTFEDSDGNASLSDGTMPRNYLNSYGSFNVNSLALNRPVKLTTESCHFPISCYYDVQLNKAENGNLSVVSSEKQKIKILPGGSLIINESVSFSCPSLANYSAYSEDKYNSQTGEESDISGYACAVDYEKMGTDGILVVNGTLAVTELGGFVQTSGGGAALSFATSSTKVYEVSMTKTTMSIGNKVLEWAQFYNFTLSASGYVGVDSTTPSSMAASSYGSKDSYWLRDIYSLSLSVTEGTSEAGASASYEITATCLPNETLSTNVSYTWSCSKEGESVDGCLSSTTGQTVTLTTPANSTLEDINYTVTCTASFTKVDGTNGTVSVTSGNFVAKATEKTKDTFTITSDTSICSKAHIVSKAVDADGNDTTETYTVSYEIVDEMVPTQSNSGTNSKPLTSVSYKESEQTLATIDDNGVVTPQGIAGKVKVKATFKIGNEEIGVVELEKDIVLHTIDIYSAASMLAMYNINKTREIPAVSGNGDKKQDVLFTYDIQLTTEPDNKPEPETTSTEVIVVNGSIVVSTRDGYEYKNFRSGNIVYYGRVIRITSKINENQSATLIFTVFGCSIPIKFVRKAK